MLKNWVCVILSPAAGDWPVTKKTFFLPAWLGCVLFLFYIYIYAALYCGFLCGKRSFFPLQGSICNAKQIKAKNAWQFGVNCLIISGIFFSWTLGWPCFNCSGLANILACMGYIRRSYDKGKNLWFSFLCFFLSLSLSVSFSLSSLS